MVEYIITLIKSGKRDEMLVTLEAWARLRNFNCACKVLSPVLHSSSVCLCTYFLPFLPAHNIAIEHYPFIFSLVAAALEKVGTETSLHRYSECALLGSRWNFNSPDWVFRGFFQSRQAYSSIIPTLDHDSLPSNHFQFIIHNHHSIRCYMSC
jgi:hypothetical protein